jgi:hypothetical protein
MMRLIVAGANPSVREAVTSEDLQGADQVLRAAERKLEPQILLDSLDFTNL